jgi:hypothetical protein
MNEAGLYFWRNFCELNFRLVLSKIVYLRIFSSIIVYYRLLSSTIVYYRLVSSRFGLYLLNYQKTHHGNNRSHISIAYRLGTHQFD